jgi:hypothetical protein
MTTIFNLQQKSDNELVLDRPHDDFVLVAQEPFSILRVEMIKPTPKSPVKVTDADYPFVRPLAEKVTTKDADGAFRLQAPKLKAGAQFHHRVYMIRWSEAPMGGPHFRIDP